MSIKVQEGKHQQLAHHGLIKLILEDPLKILRIPIAWSTFSYMKEEDEIQAIEYDKSPTSSEGEEEKEHEKEESEIDETKDEVQKDEQNSEKRYREEEEQPRVSSESTKKEALVALTTLSTPIKSKGKRQRKTPHYFRTRKSTRIKKGRPQIPTKILIIIEDSLKEQEEVVPL